MEAILADSIDLTYVGPSPTLNAYAKSNGEEVRIIAGAAAGGAALVVQPDSGLTQPADFRGKTIATPQLGNTQDVACRAWLSNGGLKITQTGGEAFIVPTPNPDQLHLFQRKKLDAVWTVEPWVSRLEREAGGKVLVEQSRESITVLVSSVKFIKIKTGASQESLSRAHRELTEWILAHPDEAKQMVRQELAAETRAEVSPDLIAQAWKRIVLTTDVSPDEYQHFISNAQRAGFMRISSRLVTTHRKAELRCSRPNPSPYMTRPSKLVLDMCLSGFRPVRCTSMPLTTSRSASPKESSSALSAPAAAANPRCSTSWPA